MISQEVQHWSARPALDVAVVKKILRTEEITDAKQILVAIVSMLVGLIKSVAPDRTNVPRTRPKGQLPSSFILHLHLHLHVLFRRRSP